jgi:hypothetical protein
VLEHFDPADLYPLLVLRRNLTPTQKPIRCSRTYEIGNTADAR